MTQGTELKGRPISKSMIESLSPRIKSLMKKRGLPPQLAVVAVGESPASGIYLHGKLKACREAGIECRLKYLPKSASHKTVLNALGKLGKDDSVDGIILELPLPRHLDAKRLLEAIPADKDVEGVTRENLGRLFSETKYSSILASDTLIPCTAQAMILLLIESRIRISGKTAVVIGRSNIVGKPTAHLLSCLDATVTLCHSKTTDLRSIVKNADIVAAAAGIPELVKGSWLKPGAVVLDAGLTPKNGKLLGDVEYGPARARASFITPVPGGVGPLTVACLLSNTMSSAERRLKLRKTKRDRLG